ncbi:phage holin family protein [Kushneria phosphatilytica]|uniref:Uncharacterized protein n=1 Tax=Kushneria phosphatilytica TaxID=657387 RepID=A0A1S1NTW8_9GAMM|nr:phage holin family protein [Kushneria phosphatilytica]OHV12994.1 hypothetical protein BH688_03045 [Kushneria phosphatilytica]QEL10865.1 hypothetical protein FY550_06815 [Kushneria phosphatilytica]
MPEQLIDLWLVMYAWALMPAQKAAICAMAMSALRVMTSGGLRKPRRWGETLMVGLLAWNSLPVVTHFGYDPDAAAFFCTFLGYIGVHGFEERVDKLLDNVAGIASALRRK